MKHPVLVSRLAVALLVVVLLLGVFPLSTPPAEAISFTLVISQFQVSGNALVDEFIELHNVTKGPIDLNGHRLVYRAEGAATDTLLREWTAPTIVPAGAYYLIAATPPAYDDIVQPDATMTGGTLAGVGGGIALRNGPTDTGAIVDSVAYGLAANDFGETANTSVPPPNSSRVRKSSGCQDTDHNAGDFMEFTPSAPRNSMSTAVSCQALVISQFQVSGLSTGGATLVSDEFIELHNVSNGEVDLNGHTLVYRGYGSTTDTLLKTWTTNTIMAPGSFYLVTGVITTTPPAYDGTVAPDATFGPYLIGVLAKMYGGLALRTGEPNTGVIVDSVAYGGADNSFKETSSTGTPAAETSPARKDGGCQDTDNNLADFELLNPSAPRNSQSAPHVCGYVMEPAPAVTAYTPAANATNVPVNTGFTVSFSEDVQVSGAWFGVTCGTSTHSLATTNGGPRNFTMTVTPALPEGKVCSARVVANLVTDLDTADPADAMLSDAVWSFTTATPPPVLSIDKSVTPLVPSLLGSVVTYTVQLQNGGGPAMGVVLSDTLPTGIAFGTWLDRPAGATADAGKIRWQGDVVSTAVVLRYTGVITTNETFAGALLPNTATFEHQGTTGSDTAQVRVASDMDVSTSTKTVDKTSVRPEEVLTFTITVRNTGSKAASVTVADSLSPFIQLKDAGDFTTNPPDGPLTWTGTVAAQGQRVLQFSARVRGWSQLVKQPLPWSFANTATLTVTGSAPLPVTSQTITVPLNRVLIPKISR